MTTGRINQVAKELSSRTARRTDGRDVDARRRYGGHRTRSSPGRGPGQPGKKRARTHRDDALAPISLHFFLGRQGHPRRQAPTDPSRPSAHCPETTHAAHFAEPETAALGTEVTPSPTSGTFGVAISTRRRRRIQNTLSTFPLRVPTGRDCQS